ncbi:MAG: hypothetical protein H7257_11560 [Taibaiella sp.]|nr:hypothetical protein [Taibaiella sp.]
MKKQFLFLAGSAILLASCGNNATDNQGQTKAQMDSTINAEVAAKEAAMKASNDSMIAAQAKIQADSIENAKNMAAAKGNGKTKGRSTTKTTTTTTTVTPPPPPSNPKDARFNETTSKKVDQAAHDKKADRFK